MSPCWHQPLMNPDVINTCHIGRKETQPLSSELAEATGTKLGTRLPFTVLLKDKQKKPKKRGNLTFWRHFSGFSCFCKHENRFFAPSQPFFLGIWPKSARTSPSRSSFSLPSGNWIGAVVFLLQRKCRFSRLSERKKNFDALARACFSKNRKTDLIFGLGGSNSVGKSAFPLFSAILNFPVRNKVKQEFLILAFFRALFFVETEIWLQIRTRGVDFMRKKCFSRFPEQFETFPLYIMFQQAWKFQIAPGSGKNTFSEPKWRAESESVIRFQLRPKMAEI